MVGKGASSPLKTEKEVISRTYRGKKTLDGDASRWPIAMHGGKKRKRRRGGGKKKVIMARGKKKKVLKMVRLLRIKGRAQGPMSPLDKKRGKKAPRKKGIDGF